MRHGRLIENLRGLRVRTSEGPDAWSAVCVSAEPEDAPALGATGPVLPDAANALRRSRDVPAQVNLGGRRSKPIFWRGAAFWSQGSISAREWALFLERGSQGARPVLVDPSLEPERTATGAVGRELARRTGRVETVVSVNREAFASAFRSGLRPDLPEPPVGVAPELLWVDAGVLRSMTAPFVLAEYRELGAPDEQGRLRVAARLGPREGRIGPGPAFGPLRLPGIVQRGSDVWVIHWEGARVEVDERLRVSLDEWRLFTSSVRNGGSGTAISVVPIPLAASGTGPNYSRMMRALDAQITEAIRPGPPTRVVFARRWTRGATGYRDAVRTATQTCAELNEALRRRRVAVDGVEARGQMLLRLRRLPGASPSLNLRLVVPSGWTYSDLSEGELEDGSATPGEGLPLSDFDLTALGRRWLGQVVARGSLESHPEAVPEQLASWAAERPERSVEWPGADGRDCELVAAWGDRDAFRETSLGSLGHCRVWLKFRAPPQLPPGVPRDLWPGYLADRSNSFAPLVLSVVHDILDRLERRGDEELRRIVNENYAALVEYRPGGEDDSVADEVARFCARLSRRSDVLEVDDGSRRSREEAIANEPPPTETAVRAYAEARSSALAKPGAALAALGGNELVLYALDRWGGGLSPAEMWAALPTGWRDGSVVQATQAEADEAMRPRPTPVEASEPRPGDLVERRAREERRRVLAELSAELRARPRRAPRPEPTRAELLEPDEDADPAEATARNACALKRRRAGATQPRPERAERAVVTLPGFDIRRSARMVAARNVPRPALPGLLLDLRPRPGGSSRASGRRPGRWSRLSVSC